MIAKIPKPGKSFKGCIEYNMNKHQAQLLDAEGVRTDTVKNIIYDFNMQRKLNPGLGQAVGHIALSWSPNDVDKLTNDIMVERAKEYMDKMKIGNTQYIIALHKDRPHPHIHIVYNRVANDGKTISDNFQKQRNVKVCKELTVKHGYYMAPGKAQVNRQQLKGADKIKYELYDGITKAVRQAQSWDGLERNLLLSGITMQYKYRSGTDEVQGISFSKWGVKLKGSEIDRSLSFGNITKQIEGNKLARRTNITKSVEQVLPKNTPVASRYISSHPAQNLTTDIAEELLSGDEQQPAMDPDLFKKIRKRKRPHL